MLGWLELFDSALKGDTAKQVVKAYSKGGAVRSCHMRVRPVLERGSARYLEMTFCDPAHMAARGSVQPDAHPPLKSGGSVAPQFPLARERSARKHDQVRSGLILPMSEPGSQSPEKRPRKKTSAPKHTDAKAPSTSMGSVVRMIAKLEVSQARQRARARSENGHLLYRYGYRGDGALSLLKYLVVMLLVALRIMSPPKMESGAGSRRASGAGSLMEEEDARDALMASEVGRLRIIAGARAKTDQAPSMKPLLRTLSDPNGGASGARSLPRAVVSRRLSNPLPRDSAPVPVLRRSVSNPPAVRPRRSLSKPLPPVSPAEQEDRNPRKVLSRTYSNPCGAGKGGREREREGAISRTYSNPGPLSRSDEARRGEAVGQRKLREYNAYREDVDLRLKSRHAFSKVLS